MITPQELEKEKDEILSNYINECINRYEQRLRESNPDSEGWYRVEMHYVPHFTPERKQAAIKAIEGVLIKAGWEIRPTNLLFVYLIRGKINEVS